MKIRGKKLGLLYLLLVLFLIPITVYYLASEQNKNTRKPQVLSKTIALPTLIPKSRLEEISKDHLVAKSGDYAVVIKNLKTGESYSYNSSKKFDSASLYKLWVMVVAFQKIKDGAMSEDEVISASIDKLNDALSTTTPTPTPQDFSPTPTPSESKPEIVSMRAGDAIEKMITLSDNYAALLVASRSGSLTVTNFLKEYGFKNSNFKQPPQTSAQDIALFFEKLYKGEIIDEAYSDKMIGILKRQTLNDRIPKYLPQNLEIAHKTGELFDSKHDGGIVYAKKGDYIFVVLSETDDFNATAEVIAKFSKEVYDYFDNS